MTLIEIGICITILSNIGVFTMIGFFLKRLIANIDTKAERHDLERIEKQLERNEVLDGKRDVKIDTLIKEVTRLIEQMSNVLTQIGSRDCIKHSTTIAKLETEYENLDHRVTRLEDNK